MGDISRTDERATVGTHSRTRRRFLQAAAVAGIVSAAGCGSAGDNETGTTTEAEVSSPIGTSDSEQIGSGRSPFGERDISDGVSMSEMPDLAGELTVYSGRGEALVGELLSFIEDRYPELTIRPLYNSASELVNQIITEGQNSPGDVFYSVNAGSLGALATRERTQSLSDETLSLVPEAFQSPDGSWVGTSGRARAIPYNTDILTESSIPTNIMSFPDTTEFDGQLGWAPTYSSFQAFITAMRLLEGESDTRQWLRGMQELNAQSYADEFQIARAVADGEIAVGFTNHYYIQRVLARRTTDAPLRTTFTQNDAGAIFNVAGACMLDTASDTTLSSNFVRHLLSAEAQDYFARKTFEYPLVPEIEPIGRLPSIDSLNPPESINLTELSNLERTITLLRETGVL
ncbi:extracellular solute-binding protein [Haloquadratum walsbyi]|jgi:ABC-type Fe3+ transport system, periplasmic component|uniref:ABC-type transport system periplasmic substrate-binding protein n=1 Tax=Haloquadratum walsbyi (strain DSM 16790 / HBSQ001) TaxID=362976 RepID=Q18H86_HALWD|nr:extracellular solute-binding protein [Haloquadratum walsbyi]CAJ52657.1 ABC-type transport system periplasmic substrate-binding protein [Haloquadratum walsbyi DSM 16790]